MDNENMKDDNLTQGGDEGENNNNATEKPTGRYANGKPQRGAPLYGSIRLLLIILGIGLIAAGVFIYQRRAFGEAYTGILSGSPYTIGIDSAYEVELTENALFTDKVLGEGLAYSSLLTDEIRISFDAKYSSEEPLEVSGSYSVATVIEGYQKENEKEALIYQNKFYEKQKLIDKQSISELKISEALKVKPAEYFRYMEEADAILGAESLNHVYAVMNIRLKVAGKLQSLTYRLELPSYNEGFYEIIKPENVVLNDVASDASNLMSGNQAWQSILIYNLPAVIPAAAGLMIVLMTAILTRGLTDDERWRRYISRMLRRHGGRMICVAELPPKDAYMVIRVTDIAHMIGLSEELKRPIMYCMNEDGFIKDGTVCIVFEAYMYIFEI